MDVKIKFDKRKFISQAEDVADTALRYSRKYLPVAARVCLLSMQLEDGFRFLFMSDRVAEYHATNWNAPYGLMLFLNYLRCLLQIAATVLCILRIKVEICVGILYGTMVLYCIIARIFSIYYFLRLTPIAGGMLLLLVENQPEAKNIFNGLPVLEESTPHSKIKDALQLLGRGLIALNFVYMVILQREWTIFTTITTVIGAVLIGLVLIGYKTKLSAITLITYLSLSNLYSNFYFLIDWNSNMFFYYRYMFFQNMTVIGGLLFIVAVGPGGVSLDEKKKNW